MTLASAVVSFCGWLLGLNVWLVFVVDMGMIALWEFCIVCDFCEVVWTYVKAKFSNQKQVSFKTVIREFRVGTRHSLIGDMVKVMQS